MEQFIEFIGNHLVLSFALVVVLVLLIQNLLAGPGKHSIDAQRATELINREEAVVLDIRAIADFGQGHIINAINIPGNGLKDQIGRLQKHKNRPIIVTCRSGAQSGAACKQLRDEGFEQVYELRGGMLSWQGANLPLSRKK